MLQRLSKDRGFFQTAKFKDWLESLLQEKVSGAGPGGTVLLKDIETPLKIIATNTTDQAIQLFGNGKNETPNELVAQAVAASICIPFFFEPHHFQQQGKSVELVDGGLLSNFPAWVFDKERLGAGPLTTTLGFTLVEKNPTPEINTGNLLEFAKRLFTQRSLETPCSKPARSPTCKRFR